MEKVTSFNQLRIVNDGQSHEVLLIKDNDGQSHEL